MRGLRLPGDVAVQVFALEFGAQVVAQVVSQELRPVGVVAVEAVHLAEGVVQGGVEGAGRHERAQWRDRFGQMQAPRHLRRGLPIGRLQRVARSIGWPASL